MVPTTSILRLGGVPEHFNLPWHLAINSHALADLNLSWQDQFGGTGEMVRRLREGELDMVSALTEGTVKAIDAGLEVTIIQVYVASALQWGIHVPAASALDQEADLQGKRIAISRFGSGSHLMAYVLADRLGWEIDESQFVVVGGLGGAVEALGEAKAEVFLWDRYMTQALVDDGSFRRVGVQPTPWPSFVIAVRNEVLAGRTTEVGRVVDAVMREAAQLLERTDVVELLTLRYELAPNVASAWQANSRFATRGAFDPAIADQVRQALAMVANPLG